METNQEPTPTPVFDFTATLNAVLAQAIQIHTAPLLARIAVLEERINNITTASDERIKEIAEEAALEAITEHNDEYDHNEYDRLTDKIDDMVSEAINDFDMEDKLRDTFRDMTFSITARY